MLPNDRQALVDIVEAARRVQRYTNGITKGELEANDEKGSAVLWQLLVLGEAVKRLSPEFRERYPDVPWKDIAGMRDVLAHQYDKIRIKVVWDAVTQGIPTLLEQVVPLVLEPQPELGNLRSESLASDLAGLDREQVGFIVSVLSDLVAIENAARQYGDARLQGAFAVAVTESNLEGRSYVVMEEERFLFSATVRDRQVTEIPVFNLAPDEFEGVRSRVAAQKEANEVILQQLEDREAEDELEP